jgi:hypothetical protein
MTWRTFVPADWSAFVAADFFIRHYHEEPNYQELGSELIDRPSAQRTRGPVLRRERMGGILTYYDRSAAQPYRPFEFWESTASDVSPESAASMLKWIRENRRGYISARDVAGVRADYTAAPAENSARKRPHGCPGGHGKSARPPAGRDSTRIGSSPQA